MIIDKEVNTICFFKVVLDGKNFGRKHLVKIVATASDGNLHNEG